MKISIITVCYNSAATLESTIKSIASQKYKIIEYIVVDGNSTDNTLEIIKNHQEIITRWISEPDMGLYDAMNKGIQMATGDIVGILNSDDFYPNESIISNVINTFKEQHCDAVFGNLRMVDFKNTNKIIRTWKSSPHYDGAFLRGWHPPHPTFFVKKEIYENLGLFDLSLQVSSDFELMLRFIEKNTIKTFFLDEYLVHMRYGGESNGSLKNIVKGNSNIYKAFKKNGFRISKFYFLKRFLNKLLQFVN